MTHINPLVSCISYLMVVKRSHPFCYITCSLDSLWERKKVFYLKWPWAHTNLQTKNGLDWRAAVNEFGLIRGTTMRRTRSSRQINEWKSRSTPRCIDEVRWTNPYSLKVFDACTCIVLVVPLSRPSHAQNVASLWVGTPRLRKLQLKSAHDQNLKSSCEHYDHRCTHTSTAASRRHPLSFKLSVGALLFFSFGAHSSRNDRARKVKSNTCLNFAVWNDKKLDLDLMICERMNTPHSVCSFPPVSHFATAWICFTWSGSGSWYIAASSGIHPFTFLVILVLRECSIYCCALQGKIEKWFLLELFTFLTTVACRCTTREFGQGIHSHDFRAYFFISCFPCCVNCYERFVGDRLEVC